MTTSLKLSYPKSVNLCLWLRVCMSRGLVYVIYLILYTCTNLHEPEIVRAAGLLGLLVASDEVLHEVLHLSRVKSSQQLA